MRPCGTISHSRGGDFRRGMEYDGGSMGATARQEENPMTAARGRLQEAIDRVRSITKAVAIVADITFGAPPEGEGIGRPMEARYGEMGLVHERIDVLEEALANLEYQVSRLSPLSIAPQPSAQDPARNVNKMR